MNFTQCLPILAPLLLAAAACGQSRSGVGPGSKYGEVQREIHRPDLPPREQQRQELNDRDRSHAESLGREYHPGVGRYEQVRGEIRRAQLERYIQALRAGDLWTPPPPASTGYPRPLRNPGDVYAADLPAGALGPAAARLNHAILAAIAHRDTELAAEAAQYKDDPEKRAAEQALTRAAFRERLALILAGYKVKARAGTTRP